MNREKEIAILSLSIVTLLLGIVLYIAYSLLWPFKTVEIKDSPMQISKPSYNRGDTITYLYDYCKYDDRVFTVKKEFVDGVIFQLDNTKSAQLEKGCHMINDTVKVPDTLPPGEYRLRVIITTNINQFRVESVISETKKFTVLGDI